MITETILLFIFLAVGFVAGIAVNDRYHTHIEQWFDKGIAKQRARRNGAHE